MIELAKEQEKVILVGVSLPGQEDTGQLLDELAFLADTAGAREVGRVIQSRDQIHPGTYVGTGKDHGDQRSSVGDRRLRDHLRR